MDGDGLKREEGAGDKVYKQEEREEREDSDEL